MKGKNDILKNKAAVIFDLDGTLVDSMGLWGKIDIEFLGSRNLPMPENFQDGLEGMSFTETAVYVKNLFALPESVEELKRIWTDMAMQEYRERIPLKPGVKEFLPYLKAHGFAVAVASSNTRTLIEAVLKGREIREYVDVIVTSCEVQKGKPAPDVYLKAAELLGTEPEKCLVFEDIVAGIQAGNNAGMTVCAVDDVYSRLQEKEKKACACYFITDFQQVIEGTYEDLKR